MDERRALVVVDLLNGFFKNNPRLPDPVEADRLIRNNRKVIDAAREAGLTIVFIKDNFLPEEVDHDRHFRIFGPHCIIGTPDAEVVDELGPRPGDYQIRKKRYSAFQGTRLDGVLRELGIKTLYLTGTWTDCCVQHTAADAFYNCYDITVIEDCVSSPDRSAHEYSLRFMQWYYQAQIISSAQVIAAWERERAPARI
jgi:nicotinamidase-related amidase